MIPIGTLLRRVVNGAAGTMEVLEGVSSLAPLRAKDNREDPWWTTERYEILRLIEALATRKALLSVREAVREARRTQGIVRTKRLGGILVFTVCPIDVAEASVVDEVVGRAMPAEMVEPRWGELPPLERFRELAERRYLGELLEQSGWNIAAAARDAGVARQTLQALLARRGLKRPS